MILASTIVTALASRLDAEGSNYYNFTDNYKPAINESVKYIVNLINYALANNKITEECLVELADARVYTTSKHSRISFDSTIWAVISVNPLPLTEAIEGATTIVPSEGSVNSYYRTDLRHIDSNYYAKRLNKEEWELNKNNPFAPGNTLFNCSALEPGSNDNVTFAYLNPFNYNNNTSAEGYTRINELSIRPYLNQKLCTVFVVKVPNDITSESGQIQLHPKLFNFLVEKCLNYIAYQQGDNTSIFQLSQTEIQSIVQILS